MGRIAVLLTGIILGVSAGYFLFGTHTGQHSEPVVAAEPKLTTTKTQEPSNPFSTTPSPTTNPEVVDYIVPTPIKKPANANTPSIITTDHNHYSSLTTFLQQLTVADSPELRAMLEQLPGGYSGSAYEQARLTAVYQRWAEVDIDTALVYAIESVKDNNSHSAQAGISIIARSDPEYVRQRINEIIPNNDDRYGLQHAVNAGIVASDPEKYVREAMTGSGQYDHQIEMAIMQWSEQDPAAAFRFLQSEASTNLSQMFQDQILYMWLERDPDTALPEIEALLSDSDNRPDQHAMLSDLYVTQLSRTDPNGAMQWAMSQNNPMVRESALMAVFHNMEYQDPDTLLALMDQLDPQEKNRLMPMMAPTIAGSMARTDPLGAMAWVEQFEQGNQYTGAKMSVFNEWVNNDPDTATTWLMSQPPSPDQAFMLRDAIYPLMERNPQAASNLFQQLPADIQLEMVEPMMYSFSERQPDAAQQWLTNQSPDVQLIGSIILDSMNPTADTYTTLEKIATLPLGQRENSLFGFVSQRGPQHTKEITKWLSETSALTDEERQIVKEITRSFGQYGVQYGGGDDAYYQRVAPPPDE